MSFSEWDFGEEFIKKSIEEATPKELFDYSYEMFRETFGYKLPTDYMPNIAVYKWLMKTYRKDGPRLVKWCFYRYHGMIEGEPFSINLFNSKHKYWIDKELFKMKKSLGEVKASPLPKRTSGIGINDILKYTKGELSGSPAQ